MSQNHQGRGAVERSLFGRATISVDKIVSTKVATSAIAISKSNVFRNIHLLIKNIGSLENMQKFPAAERL